MRNKRARMSGWERLASPGRGLGMKYGIGLLSRGRNGKGFSYCQIVEPIRRRDSRILRGFLTTIWKYIRAAWMASLSLFGLEHLFSR